MQRVGHPKWLAPYKEDVHQIQETEVPSVDRDAWDGSD